MLRQYPVEKRYHSKNGNRLQRLPKCPQISKQKLPIW